MQKIRLNRPLASRKNARIFLKKRISGIPQSAYHKISVMKFTFHT
ncbi:hypothetical protein MHA_2541 [Mannheimia haemolytica PHL213]|nr:hypothetical protein MHA_2541 [Mannheimia haemolytica PHL213]